MNFNFLKTGSHKLRVTFFTLGIFLVSIWSLAFFAGHLLRADMQHVLGLQHFSTVSLAAADLNQDLEIRLATLEKTAAKITPAMLGNADSIQNFLEDRPDLSMLFNTGNIVTRLDGIAIAEVPASTGRRGINYSDRDYVIEALKGKTIISKPVLGKKLNSPTFLISTPIRDADNKVIGVLAGTTNLNLPNFLDKITNIQIGKTGGYLLVAPQHRLIVTATDKKRIMTKLPSPGINPQLDRYMGGFEGFGVAVNSLGTEELTAAKQVPVAGWFIIAKVPTSEIFAPIRNMQDNLYLAALILSVLASTFTWWFIEVSQLNKTLEKMVEERTEELHNNEQRFRSFAENSNDLIYTLSQAGTITYVAPNVEILLGYSPSELLGTSFAPLIHQDEIETCKIFLRQIIETRTKMDGLEYRIRHKNGNWLWFVSNASFLIDPVTGEPLFFGIGRNIDDRKQMEETIKQNNNMLAMRVQERTAELLESNVRFDQLAELSRTVTWELNAQGLITYINHISELVFGYTPDEMIGRMHFYDLYPEAEREELKQAAISFMSQLKSFQNMEETYQNKNGNAVRTSTSGIPLLDPNGNLIGYRGTHTDITESKKLKEQLIQSQKMESIGQMAGGLAHDFNNILSIINGYCCLLQMDMEQDEQQKEYMGRILAASERAGELTYSMLAFSRTQVMNPQPQDLNLIVSSVGRFVEKIIGDNIEFKIIVKESPLTVNADSGQIEQVLINLTNNARDAMPDGGKMTVTTDMLVMDKQFIYEHGFGEFKQYAVITFSDTGTGMDEATRKKVFEPFFTTKDVDKGTGLGLAMVYGIVKQHSGFVDVESRPGEGANFNIYLPIVEPEISVTAASAKTVMETSGGNETIMVVEDSADLRAFMQNILKRLGYQVIAAVDGVDAVEKFRENADTVRLIIMDMIMPRKSGKQAYDEIRQTRPDIMVLFSSGYSAKIVQQQMELGENAEFIAKPVQPAVLLKKVREMLDKVSG